MPRIRHVLLLALMLLLTATATAVAAPASAATTGGSGGALTNRLNQSFTGAGLTSTYHVFAAGLDWAKPVGLMMYVDGSGGYGYDNPNSTYLLDADGAAGLVQVAKNNNLLLVVPNAPPPNCSNADNCWYNESTSPNATAKAGWSNALMTNIKGQYNIDQDRIVVGGYSSGAQWTTRWFLPLYGEAQSVDLAVPISFGGAPAVSANFSTAYKAATVVSFDTGTADTGTDGAYGTASYQSVGGYNWYTSNGFKTDKTWVAGEDHSRDDQFGGIMNREIVQWLPAGGGGTTTPPPTTAYAHTITPGSTSAKLTVNIPAGSPTLTWRMSASPITTQTGFYDNTTTKGDNVVINTTSTLQRNTKYYYQLESGSRSNVVGSGTFTTLP
jgi:poly(3-hydroxybutyrate) depolymerase